MKKSHRLLERNRIEAAGEIHRDCDYLSAENQTRLEQLMTASLEPSPFELCDLEVYRNRRIDEGIRMYRGKIL